MSTKMSPEKQRLAIAEALGLVCVRCKGSGYYRRFGKHEWFRRGQGKSFDEQPFVKCDHVTIDYAVQGKPLFPDYLNDLNEIHKAIRILDDTQKTQMGEHLKSLYAWDYNARCGMFPSHNNYWSASASLFAEAFLRTIGKWEE